MPANPGAHSNGMAAEHAAAEAGELVSAHEAGAPAAPSQPQHLRNSLPEQAQPGHPNSLAAAQTAPSAQTGSTSAGAQQQQQGVLAGHRAQSTPRPSTPSPPPSPPPPPAASSGPAPRASTAAQPASSCGGKRKATQLPAEQQQQQQAGSRYASCRAKAAAAQGSPKRVRVAAETPLEVGTCSAETS